MELKEIYEQNWKEKFGFPDLTRNVELYIPYKDAKDNLVTAGLIKKLHEIIFITDMTKSPHIRMRALVDVAIQMNRYLETVHSEQVHCFVNRDDEKFAELLIKDFGFQLIRDIPLVKCL